MPPLQVSPRALEALSAEVRKGFEQRLVRFLRQHATGFRQDEEDIWRGYERSARQIGFVTEQEIVFYIYGCYVLGDDIARHDAVFFEETAQLEDVDHRLVLIEERVLAYAVTREMIER